LLACIFIALIFWILVKLSQDYPSEKKVVFHFQLPDSKTFGIKPPDRMDVRLEGRGWELMFDYLLQPKIELSYSLTDDTDIELTREALRNSIERQIAFSSIRILENSYQPINLRLEEGLSKKVPVVLQDSLTFMPGYALQGPIKLQPDSVRVSGPTSLVSSISVWETVPFVYIDLKSTLTRKVALNPPPPEIVLNTQEVQVDIETEQVTEKSLFIALQVRNAPDSIRYFPEKVKVTCTVGLSVYNIIDTSDFAVEIDLQKVPLSEGKHTLPIQMTKKPSQALSVQFTPKSAEFFIFKQ
jgi:hypothetical protein